ncbi:uncharacterized protein LOC120913408 [Rana temporaria]|uniref:uncharacterized protein LOC120913408 n=1 Tax=Rana temporaria TaxID=8407 RepID=UPI001AAD22F6|nr:uncharacterized protein LOC120913408 [Rana temporaria]
MDQGNLKPVHIRSDKVRVQTGVNVTASPKLYGYSAAQGQGKGRSLVPVSGRVSGSKSPNSGPPGGAGTRGILPCLYSKKTIGKIQDDPEPPTSEQICEVQKVQDGVDLYGNKMSVPRVLHGNPGSQGRLPAYSHTPRLPKISQGGCKGGCKDSTFPVPSSPLWAILISENLYEGSSRGPCPSKRQSDHCDPISGRSAVRCRISSTARERSADSTGFSLLTRMDYQPRQVTVDPIPGGRVPRVQDLFGREKDLSPRREDCQSESSSSPVTVQSADFGQGSDEGAGIHDIMFSSSSLGKVSPTSFTGTYASSLEWSKPGPRSTDPNLRQSKKDTVVVANTPQSEQRSRLDLPCGKNSNYRRQCLGVGSPLGRGSSSGSLVSLRSRPLFKPKGALGDPKDDRVISEKHSRKAPASSHRQRSGCRILEQAGRDKKSCSSGDVQQDPLLGRSQLVFANSCPPKGHSEFSGRLLKSPAIKAGRVVPERGGVLSDNTEMGSSRGRSVCFRTEQESNTVLFNSPKRPGLKDRCLFRSLEVQHLLRFPSSEDDCSSTSKIPDGRNRSNFNHAFLAKETLVCNFEETECSPPISPSSPEGFDFTGSNSAPTGRQTKPNCVVSEEQLLRAQGFSERVIKTLLQCRKPVTRAIYAKYWKRFCSWLKEQGLDQPGIPAILDFLQAGVELGLSPSTLKVQVAALSIFLQDSLQQNPFIKSFFKALSRSKPARVTACPSWDLSLVLKALSESPFEPLEESVLKWVTLKTVLLVAVTSARRVSELQALSIKEPFLLIFEDRIILKTDPSFLPKVVSKFHRTQDIVLPSFCSTSSSEVASPNSLDVRRCLLIYLEASKIFRKSDSLFVNFSGSKKGQKASKSSIARWIRMAIGKAYELQGKQAPFVKAHSTRAVSSSWAERAGASPEEICKAATWSSYTTFAKHYRLDLMSEKDQAFGRRVLQAVAPP